MKTIGLLLTAVLIFEATGHAQSRSRFPKFKNKDTTKNVFQDLMKQVGVSNGALTEGDIVAGLRQALSNGAELSVAKLSKTDGFFRNNAIRILLPPEVRAAENTMRSLGMGKLADRAIESMNRAAEDASKLAAPIFIDAITKLSITDALGILRGSDTSATAFLRSATTQPLSIQFEPIVQQSLQKVGATNHWNRLATAYNKIALQKVNPNLAQYVTERAINGLFVEIGEQEQAIRKNPAARTTALLQRVFGGNTTPAAK